MMHLTISSFGGFTEQGFPDCNPSPDCYPNHRAQHHHSPLNKLFNKYCSDKGSYWLSKHSYGTAYDVAFGPIRSSTRHMLELGVGDETAASLNAWREYFPAQTQFWIVDVDEARFRNRKQWRWASKTKRKHGCFDDENVWSDPRVHTLFGTDASNRTVLRNLPLPPTIDIIIDDAAHVIAHQLASLEALWPKLAPGGVYVVEDVTVGALPWLQGAAAADQIKRAPSNNSGCGHECHYVQRPAEHPFIKRLIPDMAEQKAARAALKLDSSPLPSPVEKILDENPWYWAITGAHRGGGLDSTIIIHKPLPNEDSIPQPAIAAATPTTATPTAATFTTATPITASTTASVTASSTANTAQLNTMGATLRDSVGSMLPSSAQIPQVPNIPQVPAWASGVSVAATAPSTATLLQVALLVLALSCCFSRVRNSRPVQSLQLWARGAKQHG